MTNEIKTYKDLKPNDFKNIKFNYQEKLTKELDGHKEPFTLDTINKITLWKVNRFPILTPETLKALNSIDPQAKVIDQDKTETVLKLLLASHGIRLPMATTYLRFRNPHIYQLIDQRVHRILGLNIPIPFGKTDKKIQEQINYYFEYLIALHQACDFLDIDFCEADRILYIADKKAQNGNIDNYGSKRT